jgi:hypothetical protein
MNLTLFLRIQCEGSETSDEQLRFISAVAKLLRKEVPTLIKTEFGNVDVVFRDSTVPCCSSRVVDECSYSREQLLQIGGAVTGEPSDWQRM